MASGSLFPKGLLSTETPEITAPHHHVTMFICIVIKYECSCLEIMGCADFARFLLSCCIIFSLFPISRKNIVLTVVLLKLSPKLVLLLSCYMKYVLPNYLSLGCFNHSPTMRDSRKSVRPTRCSALCFSC